jgi:hypothetical protein
LTQQLRPIVKGAKIYSWGRKYRHLEHRKEPTMARKITISQHNVASNLPLVGWGGAYIYVGDCILRGIALTEDMNVALTLVDPTTGEAHTEVKGQRDRVDYSFQIEDEDED